MKTPFDRLTPPPGGLQALQARLDEEAAPRLPRWGLSLGVAGACAAVALVVWSATPPPIVIAAPQRHAAHATPPVDDWARALAGVDTPPAASASIPRRHQGQLALQRGPEISEGVDFYWVASTK